MAFGQGEGESLSAAFLHKIGSVFGLSVDHCQMVHVIFQVFHQPVFAIELGLQGHMGIEVGEERRKEPGRGGGAQPQGDGVVPSVIVSGLCRQQVGVFQKFLRKLQHIHSVFIQFQLVFLVEKEGDAPILLQFFHIAA